MTMQIQPITEEAHNTALLTLIAERQELLFYRARMPVLEQRIKELEQKIQTLETTTEDE